MIGYDELDDFIISNCKEAEFVTMARSSGMTTLIEDGIKKVRQGETTLDELVSVIGTQTRYERERIQCHRRIDATFIFYPFCGLFRQNICAFCKILLKPGWNMCPACGQKHNKAPKQ
jgi:hypothetical protein